MTMLQDQGAFFDALFDPESPHAGLQILTAIQLAKLPWPDDEARDKFIQDVLT